LAGIRNNVIAIVAISFLTVGILWAIGNLTKQSGDNNGEAGGAPPGVEAILLRTERNAFNGTNPDIHVVVNAPARLDVVNADVIYHDFEIKSQTGGIENVKTGNIPGGRHQLTAIIAYKPGEYEYVCNLHPEMKGRIIAEAPPS
jgi:plastocyanin